MAFYLRAQSPSCRLAKRALPAAERLLGELSCPERPLPARDPKDVPICAEPNQ